MNFIDSRILDYTKEVNKMEEQPKTNRSSKEIQERMYKNRLEKIKMRGGFTAEELIQKANNPNFYRKKHRSS
jgi:hypothetical protein